MRALFLSLLLTACAAAPERSYLLRATAPQTPKAAATKAPYALRLVTTPPYLANDGLVYLRGGVLQNFPDANWSVPAPTAVRSVLWQNLQARSGLTRFYNYPLASNIRPRYLLDVHIRELLADAEQNRLTLRADWQLSHPEEGNPPSFSWSKSYPLAALSPQAVLVAEERALSELAAAIVARFPQ